MRKKTVNRALKELGFRPASSIDGTKWYFPYKAVMLVLGLSNHKHHLERRRAKYPEHFMDIQGEPYISSVYADVMGRLHSALKELSNLKPKGGVQ